MGLFIKKKKRKKRKKKKAGSAKLSHLLKFGFLCPARRHSVFTVNEVFCGKRVSNDSEENNAPVLLKNKCFCHCHE